MFGLEHLDSYILGDVQNKWLNIIFDSPAGVAPAWVSFGIAQLTTWNPSIDFTSSIIQFDINTDLPASIPTVIAVQVSAVCNETGSVKSYRIPDTNLLDLPSSSEGWVTYSVDINELTYNYEEPWTTPNITQIEKVEILFFQTVTDMVESGNVNIDNFKAVKSSE